MRNRSPLALLLLLAVLAALGQPELALTLAPALLVAALPLSGRFPGERLIVARRQQVRMRLRPARARWGRLPEAVPLACAFSRSSLRRRGPPVAA